MDQNLIVSHIKAASKQINADLVIKNINIVDVFQSETFTSDVAIKDGFIVGIGSYEAEIIIEGTGKYICPGLVDAHAHIESSLVTPKEYSKAALLHGITSIITDPHEIANVLGVKGIELMIEISNDLLFDMYFMLSSCVPATAFESSGAQILANDLKPLYQHPKVLGLAEVMNYPAVLNCDEDMINKLLDAKKLGYTIDGHGASFTIDMLNAYISAGINTDHECHNGNEVIERLRRGMYVLMREGTVAKNLSDLIKVANVSNSRRICFCTDDKHIDDLIANGSIDHAVRIAIKNGIQPATAVQMATLNTCECYKLSNKGAIAPGFIADFIILDDLENFKINSVYKNGILVVQDNKLIKNTLSSSSIETNFENTINLPNITKETFKIDLTNKTILNAIQIIPNKLESNHLTYDIDSSVDEFICDINKDLLKIAVIERHHNTNNIGLGVINGLKLQSGAIATTISHDSQNLIVTGTNDEDMIYACNKLKEIGGGIIIVKDGQVLAAIQLEVGGLITDRDTSVVLKELDQLHSAIEELAPEITYNPFLTLSFLTLPVIPSLKITDKGLFDVTNFKFIDTVQ